MISNLFTYLVSQKPIKFNNITIYQMSKLTDLKYNTIKSYYTNCPITRVDLDVISKFCYVLNCNIEDILEYVYPN